MIIFLVENRTEHVTRADCFLYFLLIFKQKYKSMKKIENNAPSNQPWCRKILTFNELRGMSWAKSLNQLCRGI